MTLIDHRPAEAADRAVVGHWEGDLLMGAGNQSAIGTLVERSSRHLFLVHLGRSRASEGVRDALVEIVDELPTGLRRSLTWDQGKEMSRYRDFTVATGMPVFFCDPASPWQRPTNENTNGLLRQYFPKGDRPRLSQRGAPRSRGRGTQRPTAQDARLADSRRAPYPVALAGLNGRLKQPTRSDDPR